MLTLPSKSLGKILNNSPKFLLGIIISTNFSKLSDKLIFLSANL